jgi:hypothetical protein
VSAARFSSSCCDDGARPGKLLHGLMPGAPAALRPYGAGVGAPVRPRAARCDPGGTLGPTPPPARVASQCGHHVPCPPAPGAPAKKKSLHATERDTPRVQQARATHQQRTASLDLRRVKFVDDAGVNLAITRLYGRAIRGERSVGAISLNDGANITLMGALGSNGLQAVITLAQDCRLAPRRHAPPRLCLSSPDACHP